MMGEVPNFPVLSTKTKPKKGKMLNFKNVKRGPSLRSTLMLIHALEIMAMRIPWPFLQMCFAGDQMAIFVWCRSCKGAMVSESNLACGNKSEKTMVSRKS